MLITYFLFMNACSDIKTQELPYPSDASNLILILHGSGDSANDWPLEMQTSILHSFPNMEGWDIWTYDWDEYSSSKLSASKSGYELGSLIAQNLLEPPYSYEHIHLIGHSVGCFVIYGIAENISKKNNSITIHSTFLDPFTGKGLIDWTYGEQKFGQYAHFAESYYNKDDNVPSTNGLLEFSHNFDVTSLRPVEYVEDDFHWWPIDYYLESIESDSVYGYSLSKFFLVDGVEDTHEEYPRGEVTKVE